MRVRDLDGNMVDDEPEDIRDVRVVIDRTGEPTSLTPLQDVRALINRARTVALRAGDERVLEPKVATPIGKPFKKAVPVTFSEAYAPSISSGLSQEIIDKYVAMQEEGVARTRQQWPEIVDAIEDPR
jgi:hypothetical protein